MGLFDVFKTNRKVSRAKVLSLLCTFIEVNKDARDNTRDNIVDTDADDSLITVIDRELFLLHVWTVHRVLRFHDYWKRYEDLPADFLNELMKRKVDFTMDKEQYEAMMTPWLQAIKQYEESDGMVDDVFVGRILDDPVVEESIKIRMAGGIAALTFWKNVGEQFIEILDDLRLK